MAKNKKIEPNPSTEQDETRDREMYLEILSSKQEVADELKMSVYQLNQLLQKYPFELSGVPAKIMGRWKVQKSDVARWFAYVQRQELRHPESRRLRPEEPPAVREITAR